MVNITLKKSKKFHKNKHKIPRIIRGKIDKHEIIYGARALNVRFPKFLKKTTKDFDVFSATPKKDAIQTERALDKHFGGNFFFVEPAKHSGTYKVKSIANHEGYADYTKPDKNIPSKLIKGKRYVKLNFVKKHIKKTLKDPQAKFRHAKDRDALNRIKIYEKIIKKRASVAKMKRRLQINKNKFATNLKNFRVLG